MHELHNSEIVGIYASSSGRACNLYECCIHDIQPGNIVRFKEEVAEITYAAQGRPPQVWVEYVMKVILIKDGTKSCHVGFLPKHVLSCPQEVLRLNRKVVQIIDLYEHSDKGLARSMNSIRNSGMVSYWIFDDIHVQHWPQMSFWAKNTF